MAELKTKKNNASPETFLNTIKEEEKRKDAFTILELMKKATKSEPKMWGNAIIGLGDSTYTLSNGKENDWFVMGFSPRKQNFALYLTGQKAEKYTELVEKLGKYSTSRENNKGCLYIKKIADIDTKILRELFESHMKAGKKSNA
ncbi:MAG TPA: DUF1801 domain-containing protein [Bacteroidia bacterium]|jgi:hypothetical protein|nr:DUF1801 domain-containing protein [Bacteroidia bacterium]